MTGGLARTKAGLRRTQPALDQHPLQPAVFRVVVDAAVVVQQLLQRDRLADAYEPGSPRLDRLVQA